MFLSLKVPFECFQALELLEIMHLRWKRNPHSSSHRWNQICLCLQRKIWSFLGVAFFLLACFTTSILAMMQRSLWKWNNWEKTLMLLVGVGVWKKTWEFSQEPYRSKKRSWSSWQALCVEFYLCIKAFANWKMSLSLSHTLCLSLCASLSPVILSQWWFSSCFEKILNQKEVPPLSLFQWFCSHKYAATWRMYQFLSHAFSMIFYTVLRRVLNQKVVAPLIPFECFSSHFEKSSESVALYMKVGFFWWLIWGWQIKMELEIVKGGKLKHVLVEAACSHRASKLILGTKWHFSIGSVPHSILCYFSN